MKNKLAFFTMLATTKMLNPEKNIIYEKEKRTNIFDIKKEEERLKKKGLRKFTSGDKTVWALNKKNAYKKLKKLTKE